MTERFYFDNFLQPSLGEFKQHLRMTADDQDTLLGFYLKAAIERAESYIGKVIAQSQFVVTEDYSDTLPLRGPLLKVDSVEVDGVAVTYTVKDDSIITTTSGTTIKVTYVAGMKKAPYAVKAAILLTAAKYFNNPVDSVETMPSVATNLLEPMRSWGIKK